MATVWNAESALVNPAEFMSEYVSLLELSFEAGCEGGRKLTDGELKTVGPFLTFFGTR